MSNKSRPKTETRYGPRTSTRVPATPEYVEDCLGLKQQEMLGVYDDAPLRGDGGLRITLERQFAMIKLLQDRILRLEAMLTGRHMGA